MKKQVIIVLATTLVLLLTFFFKDRGSDSEPILIEPLTQEQQKEELLETEAFEMKEIEVYVIDVKGEVNDPGIYEVAASARVYDVIELAGGATELAQLQLVNLAQKVTDEMVIYVPNLNEEIPQITWSEERTPTKVSINTATEIELQTLPGIGLVKAQAIVAYRTENGPFQTLEDLTKVSGIGAKTLEALRELIQL